MAHHHDHEHHCETCSHEHHHEHNLRVQLSIIFATVNLLILAYFIEHRLALSTWQLLLVYLVPYLLVGHETLHEAW